MPSTPTHANITFNNVNVAFAHRNLVSDVTEQLLRVEETTARNQAYSKDLMMMGEGTLFASEGVIAKKDLVVVSGILNYAQAITHRLMTPRGYHPADPSFGVPWYRYLGQSYTNKLLVEGDLILDITEELYKDRRTQSVEEVRVSFEGIHIINLECKVVPVGYGRETLDVTMTTRGNT